MKSQLQEFTERFHLDRALTIEREYGIVMREAELNWVRSIVTDLDSGKLRWNSFLGTPIAEQNGVNMARILFINVGSEGHINPTLGVVQELIRRGEEVVYFTGNQMRQIIHPED